MRKFLTFILIFLVLTAGLLLPSKKASAVSIDDIFIDNYSDYPTCGDVTDDNSTTNDRLLCEDEATIEFVKYYKLTTDTDGTKIGAIFNVSINFLGGQFDKLPDEDKNGKIDTDLTGLTIPASNIGPWQAFYSTLGGLAVIHDGTIGGDAGIFMEIGTGISGDENDEGYITDNILTGIATRLLGAKDITKPIAYNADKTKDNSQLILSTKVSFQDLIPDLEKGKKYYYRLYFAESNGGKSAYSTPVRELIIPSEIPADELIEATNETELYSQLDAEGSLAINPSDTLPECGIFPPNAGTKFAGCFVNLFYYIVFVPISAVTWFSAVVLDFFTNYTISSEAYRSPFVENGWGIIRDVCNIFFIFVLLYISIKTIIWGTSGTKKLITTLVVVSILINFSLFTSKVIIDASNGLARIFYTNIEAKDTSGANTDQAKEGKSVSVAIVSQSNPQKILAQEKWQSMKDNSPGKYLGNFTLILIIAIILCAVMIYVFLTVGFLFLARVVGLWFAMIFSPLAFLSYAAPVSLPGLGHKDWWKNLMEQAFMAPIFIFLLYLILMFLNPENFIKLEYTKTASAGQDIMTTVISFAFIMFMLIKARTIAKNYSGEVGKAVLSAAAAVGGVALGAATGGVAMAGRATVGRAAGRTLEGEAGEKLREKAASGNIMAKMQLKTLEKTSKSSFDARGMKIGSYSPMGALGKQTGMKFGDVKAKGGYMEVKEAKVKKELAFAESLKTKKSDKDLIEGDDVNKARKAAHETEKNNYDSEYKGALDAKKAANPGMTPEQEADFKKDYEKTKPVPTLSLRSADEIRKDVDNKRMKKMADNLANPVTIGPTTFDAKKVAGAKLGAEAEKYEKDKEKEANKLSKELTDTSARWDKTKEALKQVNTEIEGAEKSLEKVGDALNKIVGNTGLDPETAIQKHLVSKNGEIGMADQKIADFQNQFKNLPPPPTNPSMIDGNAETRRQLNEKLDAAFTEKATLEQEAKEASGLLEKKDKLENKLSDRKSKKESYEERIEGYEKTMNETKNKLKEMSNAGKPN
ncbi:MAG: hypothetical protein WDK96_02950 [Candidatus Paceibacterota bacterium]|jgi:hypothetical protein